MTQKICIAAMLIFYGCLFVKGKERSVSTSIVGMEELLEIEETMMDSLHYYANELEEKLNTIRNAITGIRSELKKAKLNVEIYLSNPLNSFSLIRRMHEDWVNWIYYLQHPIGVEHLKSLEAQLLKLPTKTDLVEAVNAIRRLQSTYDLKTIDMATGILNGKKYDARFSALDSYTIGYELFKQSHYFEACHWIYQALQCYVENDINKALNFNKSKILHIYAEAFVKQYNFKDGLSVMENALALYPTDVNLARRKMEIEFEEATNTKPPYVHEISATSDYQNGCRGKFPFRTKNLYCRYNTTTNAFVKLAPIKTEEVNLDPYMILFHNVISDDEIEHLKQLARSSLRRATVYSEKQQKSIVVSIRTSKFSWLEDNKTEVIKRLNQRINDMTGFDIKDSELLQVVNYGLGGHYAEHYDFFNFTNDKILGGQGDRISTVLFYMSNVEQGGATVFPRIKTAVYPQKGSAIMWYNLNNRGEVDQRTMHAACPVIVGSKWVCNKWIHERNQFRTRPCTI